MIKTLVVEDEFGTRNGISMLIQESGLPCKVVGLCENGFEGLEKVKLFHPDLVITDIKMPRMDGISMIENIISWGESPKFIILSGYAEFQYAQKALKMGVEDYLLKPMSMDDFLETMERICGKLLAGTQGTDQDPPPNPDLDYPPIAMSMLKYIYNNYRQQISLEAFALQSKITPEYASHIFSTATGQTFCSFLREVRMKEAKKLLDSSNGKIYEIAYKVGYNDVKYFCRVFKKQFGISPTEYTRSKSANPL